VDWKKEKKRKRVLLKSEVYKTAVSSCGSCQDVPYVCVHSFWMRKLKNYILPLYKMSEFLNVL
jgi:hypothetical protein